MWLNVAKPAYLKCTKPRSYGLSVRTFAYQKVVDRTCAGTSFPVLQRYLCANPVIILQLQAEWRPRLSPGRRYNRNSVAGHHYCPVKIPKRTPPTIRRKHNKWEWECSQKSFRTQIRLLGFLYLFKEALIMVFSISHYVYKCLWYNPLV